jgi:energy-converting hydrogenase A subunit M
VSYVIGILMHKVDFAMAYSLHMNSKKGKAGFIRNLGMSHFQILVPQRKFEQGKPIETNRKNETVLLVSEIPAADLRLWKFITDSRKIIFKRFQL